MIYEIKTSFVLRIKRGQIKRGRGITREYCVNRSYDVTWLDHLDPYKLNPLNPLRSLRDPCFSLTRLILRHLAGVC